VIALLMGLAFTVMAHVVMCAVPTPTEHHALTPSIAAASNGPHSPTALAGPHTLEAVNGPFGCPADHDVHGDHGCCSSVVRASALAGSSGVLASVPEALGVAAVDPAGGYAAQPPPSTRALTLAVPAQFTGTAVLRMACVWRT
jgi:hypothetical protein